MKQNFKYLIWVLLTGGSLFFFIRAIYMATTGGDCFGTFNPLCSWFLLISEITISGLAVFFGIITFAYSVEGKRSQLSKRAIPKIVLITGITAYIIHFIRVAIWLILCVFN